MHPKSVFSRMPPIVMGSLSLVINNLDADSIPIHENVSLSETKWD